MNLPSSTFHYGSIKILIAVKDEHGKNNLHSTMVLLKSNVLNEAPLPSLNLHSTMVLLKSVYCPV